MVSILKNSRKIAFKIQRCWRWLYHRVGAVLVVLAVVAVMCTVAVFTRGAPFGPSADMVIILLTIDSVLLLLLATVVVRQVAAVWLRRRNNVAKPRLHTRLVLLLSLTAAVPSIVVIGFAMSFFHFGVEQWFSQRISTALEQSLEVADAYLEEHKAVIRADVLAMANDLNAAAGALQNDPHRLADVVQTQAMLRSLSEALIFDSKSNVLARSGLTFSLEFEPLPPTVLAQVRRGQVVLVTTEDGDRVRALVQLQRYVDAFLYVGRAIDPQVIDYIRNARASVDAYRQARLQRSGIQFAVIGVFLVIGLLLLLVAAWVGVLLANRLLAPLNVLVEAAERVRKGESRVQVPLGASHDETRSLILAFNHMTADLADQQEKLLSVNQQLQRRRKFIEAVLQGVTSCVIGVDNKWKVRLANKRATNLLHLPAAEKYSIFQYLPELQPIATALTQPLAEVHETQLRLFRGGISKTLLLRISSEHGSGGTIGYVLTLDDITDFLQAQKTAAWADVARRLAHEIKNPLTPIQLSADRLHRKYLKQISDDPETFSACINTIIRQVDDIGRMVTEFSAFARMPQPVKQQHDIRVLCGEVLILQQQSHPHITFETAYANQPMPILVDAGQVRQALNNVIKNACEAIEERPTQQGDYAAGYGKITVQAQVVDTQVQVTVSDNGKGLPVDERDKLTEPYFTDKEKGTGLGLAIVKKIIEDHGGVFKIDDVAPVSDAATIETGAVVTFTFPLAVAP